MEAIWSLVTVLGPILLIAALIYIWSRNRKGKGGSVAEAERGAERVQEKVERDQTR